MWTLDGDRSESPSDVVFFVPKHEYLEHCCIYRRPVHLEEVQTLWKAPDERAPSFPEQRARSTVLVFSALSRKAAKSLFRTAAGNDRAQEGKAPFALIHAAAGLVQ